MFVQAILRIEKNTRKFAQRNIPTIIMVHIRECVIIIIQVENTAANEKADEVTSTTPELATPSITVPPPTTPTIIRPKAEPKPAAESTVSDNVVSCVFKENGLSRIITCVCHHKCVVTCVSIHQVTSLLLTDLLTDTTSQHDSHVFDHNCDICLGKKIDTTKQPIAATPDECVLFVY